MCVCAACFSQVCRIVRAFDPIFAAQHLVPHMVDEMMGTLESFSEHVSATQLKAELPAYLVAAAQVNVFDRGDVSTFTTKVLQFWKSCSNNSMSEWRKAARILFSMSPNSASCERVFSMLNNMYGSKQTATLSDHVQSSIMLRFNKRSVHDDL